LHGYPLFFEDGRCFKWNKVYWEHMRKNHEDGIDNCPYFLEHLVNNGNKT
jgi:hypothetical protein